MPRVVYTTPAGTQVEVDGQPGDSVMATAVRNGVTGIVGQCGGTLSCATCHVYVSPESLGIFDDPVDDEEEMLECTASDRLDTSRLSCQLVLGDGPDVHVTIPDEQV